MNIRNGLDVLKVHRRHAETSLNHGSAAPARVRFDRYCLDLQRGCLLAGDVEIELRPKTFEFLRYLVSHPGRLVSKDELLAAVWPDVVVTEDSLFQCVAELRRALQDQDQHLIKTVQRRGYRFDGAVSIEPCESAPQPAAPTHLSLVDGDVSAYALRARNSGQRRRALTVAAISTLAVIAAACLIWATSEKTGSPVVDAYLPEKLGIGGGSMLPTVAVLPFDSLPDQSAHAYLARGIVADLITDLSRLANVQVTRIPQIGDEAPSGSGPMQSGARYLVSGNVQHAGDQLKVNVQLTDSRTGRNLWSEQYKRPFQDLFAVQEEIVAKLVVALRVEVSEAERRRLAARHTRNLDAYDQFLRAKAAWWTHQRAENEKARQLYREAVRLDPGFALAYAGLALTYAADYRNQWTEQPLQALIRAGELAETAFEIDPDILEVHWVQAYVHIQGRRHEQAMACLKRAMTLDPRFGETYFLLGTIYTYIGEPKKAVAMLRAGARLTPERPPFMNLGRAYFFLGDVEQASINFRETLSRNAAYLEARVYLAATLALAGDRNGARWEAEEVRVLEPAFSASKWLQTYPMTDARQKRQLGALLEQLGL
jgi:adenylate cyclase